MILLTIEQLLQLHVLVIHYSGGSQGVRDIGRLEAAVASQIQTVFGRELYPEPYDKAAAIIRGIICDHPFHDGNKRTAMLAGLTFLKVNNIIFSARQGELEDFAVRVAVERLNVDDIAAWLKNSC